MEIPARAHLFVDSNFKEEMHDDPVTSLINRFDLICRFCLDENGRLLDIFGSNDFVMMTESLVDVKIDAYDMLPKQICINCNELLNQCLAFKQQIAASDIALRQCIDQLQQVEIRKQKEGVEASDPGITDNHIFAALSTTNELADGHKFEDLIDEESTPDDELVPKKDSNLYSAYDGTPVAGNDFSQEVKSEPVTSPRDVVESPRNVQHKSRTSVKFEQCDKEFSCNSILQRHIKLHAVEKYQCNVCSKSFSRKAGLKGHMSSHESSNEDAEEQTSLFKCAKCHASFALERDLYIHGSIHPDDDNIRCRECSKDFPSLTKLRRHVKTHFEDKPIKCDKCGRGFLESGALTRHYRVHTNGSRDRKHMRKECGKASLDSYALLRHCKHTGEKPYKCSHCSKSFQWSSALAIHVRTHTGEKPYKCPVCLKSFGTSSTLAFHARMHTGEKPYKCSHCSKAFRTSSALTMHLRTHTGEKPYKCPHCSKQYRTSSALSIHIRTHTGEKPYKCPHCAKAFGNSSSLTLHVGTHTGKKPHKCSLCSKSFGRSSTLAFHVRTHIGEKPYKCSHCSNAFGNSSALKIHFRKHTGEKPCKCPHCAKAYRTSSALSMHVRTHTGVQPLKLQSLRREFPAAHLEG